MDGGDMFTKTKHIVKEKNDLVEKISGMCGIPRFGVRATTFHRDKSPLAQESACRREITAPLEINGPRLF